MSIESKDVDKANIKVDCNIRYKFETTRLPGTFEHDRRLIDASKDDRHSITFDEEHHVDDYRIARYQTKRTIKISKRYGYVDLISYSLVVASEVLEDEPSSVSST